VPGNNLQVLAHGLALIEQLHVWIILFVLIDLWAYQDRCRRLLAGLLHLIHRGVRTHHDHDGAGPLGGEEEHRRLKRRWCGHRHDRLRLNTHLSHGERCGLDHLVEIDMSPCLLLHSGIFGVDSHGEPC